MGLTQTTTYKAPKCLVWMATKYLTGCKTDTGKPRDHAKPSNQ